MNLIFPTQSSGLKIFWQLMKAIGQVVDLDKIGFSVADHYYYLDFIREFPEIESGKYFLLKEWEIIQSIQDIQLDPNLISEYERLIGDSTLWNALVADRRIYNEKKCKFQQDYVPRFNHEQMLRILQNALVQIDKQFEIVQPDAVVALNAVTFCDYIYYLFAKKRDIPYFQLKLTRIENYVSFITEPFELSPHILNYYDQYRNGHENKDADYLQAMEVYEKTRNKRLTYEGAINLNKSSERIPVSTKKVFNFIKKSIHYSRSPAYNDNHFPGILTSSIHQNIFKPLRARRTNSQLRSHYCSLYHLINHKYAFYPMHTEPEVALSVFGRPYQNQIETIRNIAMNIPVSWKLVVKDHPNAWGFHSKDYYKKILSIPNVIMLESTTSSQIILKQTKLAVVVNGTIGLEAIMAKIPLITLGYSPYYVFPESMVRHVSSIYNLSSSIASLMSGYQYDEGSVIAYLAAHIKGSIRISLFTELLGKGGRNKVPSQKVIQEQYSDLAEYTLRRIAEEKGKAEVKS